MKHIAAYLLLQLGGKESPSAADIKSLLDSVSISADDERLDKLISELEGKDINEVRIMCEVIDCDVMGIGYEMRVTSMLTIHLLFFLQLIAEGAEKLASVPSGGGGGAAPAAAAAGGAAPAAEEKKEEKKEEEKEESDDDMGFGLFD